MERHRRRWRYVQAMGLQTIRSFRYHRLFITLSSLQNQRRQVPTRVFQYRLRCEWLQLQQQLPTPNLHFAQSFRQNRRRTYRSPLHESPGFEKTSRPQWWHTTQLLHENQSVNRDLQFNYKHRLRSFPSPLHQHRRILL